MESDSSELMEFPYYLATVRRLMVDLVSTGESSLSPHLLPCTLPPDVQRYQNPTGSALASLLVRSGSPSSPVDFMVGSWLHCELPTGSALNIAGLSCYLNEATDTPHFLMEIIQSSATSMVFVLDLLPRKDLVLHPEYLHPIYEETQLEKQRQLLYAIPEAQPYFASSLYFRSVVSPTAILVRIDTAGSEGAESRLDEIGEASVGPVAKQVLGVWMNCFADAKWQVAEVGEERKQLKERDRVLKRMAIEIDLHPTCPGCSAKRRLTGSCKSLETSSIHE